MLSSATKGKKENISQGKFNINSVMFLSNMIKIAKIAVLEDVKPNLQPIRAKRCQMYCFCTNQTSRLPDSDIFTCDLLKKCIKSSIPWKTQ